MSRIDRRSFHPLFHEVVVVDVDDDETAPPVLVEELWPGFMMGSLVFTRAGVRVVATT